MFIHGPDDGSFVDARRVHNPTYLPQFRSINVIPLRERLQFSTVRDRLSRLK